MVKIKIETTRTFIEKEPYLLYVVIDGKTIGRLIKVEGGYMYVEPNIKKVKRTRLFGTAALAGRKEC